MATEPRRCWLCGAGTGWCGPVCAGPRLVDEQADLVERVRAEYERKRAA